MELKNYKEGDEHKIVELFELVFKQEMTLDHWYWRFSKNPAGNHLIKLMWDGDQLIGHYAVSPIMVNVNGEEVLTAHSLTTMTHPDYGGRGIFKTLSLELYKELEEDKGCKAIWGFPNNNSHGGFIKSLGWSNIAVIHTMGIKASNIPTRENRSKIVSLKAFDQSHADFVKNRENQKSSVFVSKSLNYLNWRYVSKPDVDYKKFEIKVGDSIKGVIITKIYPSTLPNHYDLNIVECIIDDYDYLHKCLNQIMEEYNLPFDRVTIWKNLFDTNHLLLEKNGFIPVLPQTYFGARIHSSMPLEFSEYKNWDIAMGDSDVY
jgi:hypothetical protein